MIVRIQGKVTAIDVAEGVNATTQKPWSRKSYTISDDFRDPSKNRSLRVDDWGRLDPNSMVPVFIYHSNHIVGDKVDIACFIETNEKGFTHVDYGKEWEDIEVKPASNVVKPEETPAEEPQPVPMQEESESELPF